MKLKNSFKYAVCFITIAITASTIPISAAEQDYILVQAAYNINIVGKPYQDDDNPVLNYKGTTYAPLRSMLSSADLDVAFEEGIVIVKNKNNEAIPPQITEPQVQTNKSSVTPIREGLQEYILVKANYAIHINGEPYQDNDNPVLNYKGTTYAPLRSMLTAAGLKVDFKNDIAEITSEPTETPEKYLKERHLKKNFENGYIWLYDIDFTGTGLSLLGNLDMDQTEIWKDRNPGGSGYMLLRIPKEKTKLVNGFIHLQEAYYYGTVLPLIRDPNPTGAYYPSADEILEQTNYPQIDEYPIETQNFLLKEYRLSKEPVDGHIELNDIDFTGTNLKFIGNLDIDQTEIWSEYGTSSEILVLRIPKGNTKSIDGIMKIEEVYYYETVLPLILKYSR